LIKCTEERREKQAVRFGEKNMAHDGVPGGSWFIGLGACKI
jgi:hypothetical protein